MLWRICSLSTNWASAATRIRTSSNSSLPAALRADHVTAAQQVDEILEQGAVEELGGVEAVEHRDALGVQLAALLEHRLRDLAAAGGDQLRDDQVIALDRLDGGLCQHGELHGLA